MGHISRVYHVLPSTNYQNRGFVPHTLDGGYPFGIYAGGGDRSQAASNFENGPYSEVLKPKFGVQSKIAMIAGAQIYISSLSIIVIKYLKYIQMSSISNIAKTIEQFSNIFQIFRTCVLTKYVSRNSHRSNF